jgi:MYXO-CTERM domain-containing protein
MRRTSSLFAALALLALPTGAAAQAACVDGTGMACLNTVSAMHADGVVNDIFTTADGLFAPQLHFAHYMRGVNGCIGQTTNPLVLTGYACGAAGTNPPGGNDPAFQANSLDWYWTQVLRTRDDGSTVNDGEAGSYTPWRGRIYDLGGEANRVVVFPVTDHGPLPCEAFEYTLWLSNNPDATSIAPATAPDPMQWNEARLIRIFTEGWTRNPRATGAGEASRTDLGTWLRDTSAGDAVADSFVTVWSLPCGLSFRYVAMQAGNPGNPGPECTFHSSDDELDAIAGLNEDNTSICLDGDGDGHRDATCGGDDCDDTDPAVHPGAFQPCGATRSFNCLPMSPCPMGTACDASSGLCLNACFEGACQTGFTCNPGGFCEESACAARTTPCPAGTVCHAGDCVDPCMGVVCPGSLHCVGGACVDLCLGVVCPSMQICIANQPGAATLCGPACTCLDLASTTFCGAGTACDTRMGSVTAGMCVDAGCETASCTAGQVCRAGACVDACAGVTCPLGQLCQAGTCVVDLCANVSCGPGLVCHTGSCVDPCSLISCMAGQRCRAGACEPDPCAAVDCGPTARCVEGSCVNIDAGPIDAGAFDASASDAGRHSGGPTSPASCGCRVGGGGERGAALGLALLALVAMRRRRRT